MGSCRLKSLGLGSGLGSGFSILAEARTVATALGVGHLSPTVAVTAPVGSRSVLYPTLPGCKDRPVGLTGAALRHWIRGPQSLSAQEGSTQGPRTAWLMGLHSPTGTRGRNKDPLRPNPASPGPTLTPDPGSPCPVLPDSPR